MISSVCGRGGPTDAAKRQHMQGWCSKFEGAPHLGFAMLRILLLFGINIVASWPLKLY